MGLEKMYWDGQENGGLPEEEDANVEVTQVAGIEADRSRILPNDYSNTEDTS